MSKSLFNFSGKQLKSLILLYLYLLPHTLSYVENTSFQNQIPVSQIGIRDLDYNPQSKEIGYFASNFQN